MLYILVQSSLDMVSVNANLTTVTLANDKLQRPVHRSLNNHTLFPIFFFCTLPLVLHIQLLPQQVEHLHLIKVWASSFFIIPNIRIAKSCNVWKCSSILNTLYKRPTGHISLIWTIVLASFFFESVYYEVTSEKKYCKHLIYFNILPYINQHKKGGKKYLWHACIHNYFTHQIRLIFKL